MCDRRHYRSLWFWWRIRGGSTAVPLAVYTECPRQRSGAVCHADCRCNIHLRDGLWCATGNLASPTRRNSGLDECQAFAGSHWRRGRTWRTCGNRCSKRMAALGICGISGADHSGLLVEAWVSCSARSKAAPPWAAGECTVRTGDRVGCCIARGRRQRDDRSPDAPPWSRNDTSYRHGESAIAAGRAGRNRDLHRPVHSISFTSWRVAPRLYRHTSRCCARGRFLDRYPCSIAVDRAHSRPSSREGLSRSVDRRFFGYGDNMTVHYSAFIPNVGL